MENGERMENGEYFRLPESRVRGMKDLRYKHFLNTLSGRFFFLPIRLRSGSSSERRYFSPGACLQHAPAKKMRRIFLLIHLKALVKAGQNFLDFLSPF